MRIFHSFLLCLFLSSIFTSCAAHKGIEDNCLNQSIVRARALKETNRDQTGAMVVCKETPSDLVSGDNQKSGKTSIKAMKEQGITLETSGFCPGKRYALYVVNAVYDKTCMGKLIANENGELVFEKDGFPVSKLVLHTIGCMKGEQIFYAFLSEDDQSCLTVACTPKPIDYRWNDGAYVCATLLDKDAKQLLIAGKGFQPGESVISTSKTCGETLEGTNMANSDGTLLAFLLPGVIGVEGASGVYTIKREHTDEVGTLNYLWGTAATSVK